MSQSTPHQESPKLTRQQQRAQEAFSCVSSYAGERTEYKRIAKRFPALVHTCGLAQACAFVLAKDPIKNKTPGKDYLEHLSQVMDLSGANISEMSRERPFSEYMRLSFEAVESGSWLKRYAEAFIEDDKDADGV